MHTSRSLTRCLSLLQGGGSPKKSKKNFKKSKKKPKKTQKIWGAVIPPDQTPPKPEPPDQTPLGPSTPPGTKYTPQD